MPEVTWPVVPAGLLRRLAAAFIDSVVVVALVGIIWLGLRIDPLPILLPLVAWLYSTFLESSAYRATLGKMALGIAVNDMEGERLSFPTSALRQLAKALAVLPLGLGYLMILVDPRKQGLHDKLTNSLVERVRTRARARRALDRLLKQLRKRCGDFKTSDEWYEFIAGARPALERYAQVLPVEGRQLLSTAERLVDTSRAGINQACDVLQAKIERVIGPVTVIPVLPPLILAGFIAAAGVSGAMAVHEAAVEPVGITIVNRACDSIPLKSLPLGITANPEMIEPGKQGVLSIPKIMATITVTATPNMVEIKPPLLPSYQVSFRTTIVGLDFNGESLLNASKLIDLTTKEEGNRLVVTCR